ncbi:MAG: hypothetical protein ACXVCV_23555 [Polyangia bacterium]
MFARTWLWSVLLVAPALALAAPSARAEEPEFQIVGTVEHQTLSLTILPRPGFRLGADTPVLVRLDGAGVELPRKLYRREDAVDPRAEAPRFEVAFRRAAAAAPAARIDAELTFYVCKAARCRPVVTRYGTSL